MESLHIAWDVENDLYSFILEGKYYPLPLYLIISLLSTKKIKYIIREVKKKILNSETTKDMEIFTIEEFLLLVGKI